MAGKQCPAGHEPHPPCSMSCCTVTPDRAAQIKADARSGRNWASEPGDNSIGYGAGCVCGAGLRTLQAARAFKGMYGIPTGRCDRHPGGTVIRDSDRRS